MRAVGAAPHSGLPAERTQRDERLRASFRTLPFASAAVVVQAGAYSATLQDLKAVKGVGKKDSDAVVKKLKELSVNDAFTSSGHVPGQWTDGVGSLSV
jgi:hypothetical protein